MSVSSKMTAIADKIRAILGTAGAMGLDSMTNNLGTVQTNITDAFTAIGNKGGNVPSSKVSGNLATAINSIPDGVMVQRVEGTFTTDENGESTVNCGFCPDIVYFEGEIYTEDFEEVSFSVAVCFAEENRGVDLICIPMWSSYGIGEIYAVRNTSGFQTSSFLYSYDGLENAIVMAGVTVKYVAIKYT